LSSSDGELDESSTCRKFRRVAGNGKEYNTNFYNLEAVIAVGFRTNSERAIVFRQSVDALTTKSFFKTVQNKLHFAIHGKTAAELIIDRANSEKENMGLTAWKNSPKGKILKSDVSVAKNYLSLEEMA